MKNRYYHTSFTKVKPVAAAALGVRFWTSPHKAGVGYCQSDGLHCHLGLSPEHQGELQEESLQALLSMRSIKVSLSPRLLLSLFMDKKHVLFEDYSPLNVHAPRRHRRGVKQS